MALLFEEDYQVLNEAGLEYEEDEASRFLVIKNFPLSAGMYVSGGNPVTTVAVLSVIPANYNTAGCDMFWVFPQLARADGQAIPAISGPNQNSRIHKGIEYCRWSRHWNKQPWKPKADKVQKILDRLEWALRNPDPDNK
ncbi:E2/UBC family protein [Bradyrhizobium ivorense]|uniref:E2/UBC family protein n=1 Tax=Bradyrhizobium ivorense TaxID=2511166 RepID=UPI0010B34A33|nr:E2/UBC family protein [Bradyrhizobium ivorense]VIO79182.1 hypothetical protein CI41S_67500 [Bradyrhizobium ivorense]